MHICKNDIFKLFCSIIINITLFLKFYLHQGLFDWNKKLILLYKIQTNKFQNVWNINFLQKIHWPQ